MQTKNISRIDIYARGKNRDVYGNPYMAWKAIIHVKLCSYYRRVIIQKDMSYGDSGKDDCLKWAVTGINEALGLKLKTDDKRINYQYKHVSRDSDLEHPENWKVEV